MRSFLLAAVTAAFLSTPLSASLPRMAVISIDFDEFAPDSLIISGVMEEIDRTGRFEPVDLGPQAFLDVDPRYFLDSLRTLAGERDVDVFMALEILHPEQRDRTVYRNDSLVTMRHVSVEALARFYTSTGSLAGTLRNTVSREVQLPFEADVDRMAALASLQLVSRSLAEVFPVEVTFIASSDRVFTVPLGAGNGLAKGTVMGVLAVTSGIPTDVSEYEMLRSRGLLQIVSTGESASTARLLSGRLVEGGLVTAVETTSPAFVFLEYSGSTISVRPGTDLGPEADEWAGGLRLGVATGKWGLSFGGGITAGGLKHSSMVGVNLQTGMRVPLRSPELGLRLTAGGELAFHMQDVRSVELSSNATAISLAGAVDATLEYLFSAHLGLQAGVSGMLGSTVRSWTVQEYSGFVRDAEPDELFYEELKQGPLGVRAGLMYFIF